METLQEETRLINWHVFRLENNHKSPKLPSLGFVLHLCIEPHTQQTCKQCGHRSFPPPSPHDCPLSLIAASVLPSPPYCTRSPRVSQNLSPMSSLVHTSLILTSLVLTSLSLDISKIATDITTTMRFSQAFFGDAKRALVIFLAIVFYLPLTILFLFFPQTAISGVLSAHATSPTAACTASYDSQEEIITFLTQFCGVYFLIVGGTFFSAAYANSQPALTSCLLPLPPAAFSAIVLYYGLSVKQAANGSEPPMPLWLWIVIDVVATGCIFVVLGGEKYYERIEKTSYSEEEKTKTLVAKTQQ